MLILKWHTPALKLLLILEFQVSFLRQQIHMLSDAKDAESATNKEEKGKLRSALAAAAKRAFNSVSCQLHRLHSDVQCGSAMFRWIATVILQKMTVRRRVQIGCGWKSHYTTTGKTLATFHFELFGLIWL